MKYLVVGAGGTGGCIGGYLEAAGKDVTIIARGTHLQAIQGKGLMLRGTRKGELHLPNIHATTADAYAEKADVIFLCVKGYSVDGVLALLERASHPNTVVIPVLNIVGTGGRIAQTLSSGIVLDGCIYISAYISAPGEITQSGEVFRIVFGEREGNTHEALLQKIARDITECDIDITVSEQIQKDAFRKYIFISAFAAAGAYHNATTTELLHGEPYETFAALLRELLLLAQAQGFAYEIDLLEDSIRRIKLMGPGATTSMQKDLKKGGESEIDGLVFEPVRLAQKLGIDLPAYRKVAVHFGYKG